MADGAVDKKLAAEMDRINAEFDKKLAALEQQAELEVSWHLIAPPARTAHSRRA